MVISHQQTKKLSCSVKFGKFHENKSILYSLFCYIEQNYNDISYYLTLASMESKSHFQPDEIPPDKKIYLL